MNNPHSYSLLAAASQTSAPTQFGATMVLFLLLVGTLGLLAVLTLVRWSLRRANRIAQSPARKAVPESPWKIAGKRAKPIEDEPDEGKDE